MTAMLPANLTETLTSLGEAARELTVEVRVDRERTARELADEREAMRKRDKRTFLVLALVAVLVLALAGLSVANRMLGNRNAQLNRQNAEIITQIKDCTTAGGECYERSQRNTAGAVGQLVRANIFIGQCEREGADTVAEVEKCVADLMKDGANKPGS